MIKVFIGYDSRETVAYHVAAHSLARASNVPVSITPLEVRNIPGFNRQRDKNQSTDFAYSRFMVPYLCGYEGWAIFMDCDVLVRANIGWLYAYQDATKAVQVVKHDYTPKTGSKFLGQPQTVYPKKNWSSVMLFNNERCKVLTPDYVNRASGMELHQFKWCEENEVGELPNTWNHLVGEENQCPLNAADIVHYTLGTPCFEAYSNGKAAEWWYQAKQDMVSHDRRGECVRPRSPE